MLFECRFYRLCVLWEGRIRSSPIPPSPTHTHTHTLTHTQTNTHADAHTHTHTFNTLTQHKHTLTHTHTHACSHTCLSLGGPTSVHLEQGLWGPHLHLLQARSEAHTSAPH